MMTGQSPLKILVAEDDELIGELLGEMLAGMGHEVCAIEVTEAGAVVAARQSRPDLLIVDIHLNPGCGIAAVDAIQHVRPVPHILVSGNIASLRARRPDAVMLEKPYTLVALCCAMRRARDSGKG